MDAGDIDLGRFLELETSVWDALCHGDAEADARLLAEDFVGLYPSGFADRSDHVAQLANGPTVAEFVLDAARLIVLSETDVLLCYRAVYRRATSGERGAPESMYVSSLWCRRSGRWVNVFSQDTPAGATNPP